MSAMLQRIFILITVLLSICSIAFATDFRVENRIYAGDQKEPASSSLTIFSQHMVYDFLRDPAENIVFDKSDHRFIILDDTHHIRTELTTATVDSFVDKLKNLPAKKQDPLMEFLADPVFNERFDPARGELILQSPMVNYRAILTTVNDISVPNQYREFADQNVKLSAVLIPGSRSPFARLKLNDAIARRESIAREVILTITPDSNKNASPSSIRSEHTLSMELTPADNKLMQQARKSMTEYKLVPYDKYRQTSR